MGYFMSNGLERWHFKEKKKEVRCKTKTFVQGLILDVNFPSLIQNGGTPPSQIYITNLKVYSRNKEEGTNELTS